MSNLFRTNINLKPGVFQPVTGQAIVIATTCVDDQHAAKMIHDAKNSPSPDNYPLKTGDKDLVSRVESHCIALKKKNSKSRYFKGSGCSLKIFTALNGMERDKILDQCEHVGVVQTAINPNDKTKPSGFRTNATRIGGTVSLINTGDKDIYANMPVYWDLPGDLGKDANKTEESECGGIKGHPEGIIYPATRMLEEDNEVDQLYTASKTDGSDDNVNKKAMKTVLMKRRRVVGWSLNHAKPGEQLDLILKR